MSSGKSKRKLSFALVLVSLGCMLSFLSWSNFDIGDIGLRSAPVVLPFSAPPDAENRAASREGAIQSVRGDSDGSSEAAYLDEVADIQKASVETSLRSNDKLRRYDGLTAEDVEELKANSATFEGYGRRAKDLNPPTQYEDQHEVFVLAIGELRDADELAYRLAADPYSATQTDFEAYDRHVDRATEYLRKSNDLLGKDHMTTGAAQEVSLG